jgi:death on curing protein
VLAIHAQAIEEFGGLHGVRDAGALEAALTAVENRAYYEHATLTTCAATYAYHLTQAHAFLDGNKRIAAAVAEISLELNGAELRTTNEEIVAVFLAIAAVEVSRQDVELWFVAADQSLSSSGPGQPAQLKKQNWWRAVTTNMDTFERIESAV